MENQLNQVPSLGPLSGDWKPILGVALPLSQFNIA
jgi:hypothetical protein